MTILLPINRVIAAPARMFLDMETRGGLNVAVSYVLVLDGPLSPGEVHAAVAELKAVSPRLSQRIVRDASGHEQWAPTDAEGQLDFVELPSGSGPADVLERCSELQERVFPLDRQLWHVVYYSGLSGGRSALLVRLHHAVGNGEEALSMLASAFGVDGERKIWIDVPQHDSTSASASQQAPDDSAAGDLAPAQLNSRHQQVSVLDFGTRQAWEAVAARCGATLDVLSVSLLASAMLRYWERTGISRDAVMITLPATSEWLVQNSNGALNTHVATLRVTADWVGPDRLAPLSALLAFELVASEQRALEAWQSGAALPGPAMSELLLTPFVTMPDLVVRGRRVVDYSAFAPVTGTHVVASPIDYDGRVRMCVNLDTALVSAQEFEACLREAWDATGE